MTLPHATDRSHPATSPDELSLIARIRAGDEAAFGELYATYHDALWKFAYGFVRSSEIAEELVQEVFLGVWSRRAAWDVHTRVRSWLYAAVRNQALNHLRHERVARRAFEGASVEAAGEATMGAAAADIQELIEVGELERTADQALATLSGRCQLAMSLRWKHDLSPSEIAEVLGATPGSVRVLLTRARQELASLMKRPRR